MHFMLTSTLFAIVIASAIAAPSDALQEVDPPVVQGISLLSANNHKDLIANRSKDLDSLKSEILMYVELADIAIKSGKQSVGDKVSPAVRITSLDVENTMNLIRNRQRLAEIQNLLRESACWSSHYIKALTINANEISTTCTPTWEYNTWNDIRDGIKELVDAAETFGPLCGSLYPSSSQAEKVNNCITSQINTAKNLARTQYQDLTYKINGATNVAIYCIESKQREITNKLDSLKFCSD